MINCKFTNDGGAAPKRYYKNYIVILKNYILSIVISLYDTSIVILHYVLVINFHYTTVKSQKFLTVYIN